MAEGATIIAGSVVSGMFANSGIIFLIFLLAGIFGLFFWLFMRLITLKIKVDFEERIGENVVEYSKRGGIIKDRYSGVKELVIPKSIIGFGYKNALKGPVPNNELFRQDKKGRRSLRLFKDSEEAFKVIAPLDLNTLKEAPVDIDWLSWGSTTLRAHAPRFRNDKGFLDKWGNLMGLGMVAIVFVFIAIFWFQDHTKSADSLARVAEAHAQVAEDYKYITEVMYGSQNVPQSQGAPIKQLESDSEGGG